MLWCYTLPKLGLLAIFSGSCAANLLWPLQTKATEGALKYQPVLDFDRDSCYHTAAVDGSGRLNEGLNPQQGRCHDRAQLYYSQTYARQRCNHGWCAYLYGYYFEKDDGAAALDHKHDWEHVIVWTLNDELLYVSWSAHGDYTTQHRDGIRFHEGTHPKIVSHRGGWRTHSFRKAEPADDDIENDYGVWFKASLVSIEMMDCNVRRPLLTYDWGSAHPDIAAVRFRDALDKAMPWDARNNEHFDPRN